jgi:hypothetical protein
MSYKIEIIDEYSFGQWFSLCDLCGHGLLMEGHFISSVS